MGDPFTWSFPIGRLFGITIRIHLLFPLVVLGLVLRAGVEKDVIPGTWQDMAWLTGLLFASVLLHEFGHCFAARWVHGEASEVMLWPLGGLAAVDVPHTPRANFITAAGGPAVNLLICLLGAAWLGLLHDPSLRPTWDLLSWAPFRSNANGGFSLACWDGKTLVTNHLGTILLAQLFYVNFLLLAINVLLIGFPMDGGRMFQCILWKYIGYRQATLYAVYAGFVTMFIVLVFGFAKNEVLPLCLAIFIYVSCKQQWLALEAGGEESVFGYDFSQGYTSLERDQPPPQRKKLNFIQRWQQRRAARKLQLEQEREAAEESRMDELLEKIQREGKQALSDEENRFLKRVADKYRNRP